MWNRRKDEDFIPKPTQAPPTSASLAREGIPLNTLPQRTAEYEPARSATIGKSVIVKGNLVSREDLYVDGEVEGTVEMTEHKLTVGPNGRIQASVKAREIVVLGTIHGNVDTVEKIEIRKDAKLVGDIRTVRIEIQDGAFFKGSVDIVQAPKPKETRQPVAAAAAAASTLAGTPVASGPEKP